MVEHEFNSPPLIMVRFIIIKQIKKGMWSYGDHVPLNCTEIYSTSFYTLMYQ